MKLGDAPPVLSGRIDYPMPWLPHLVVSDNEGYLFWGPYNKDPTI